MDVATLNEYLFADLLGQWAKAAQHRRVTARLLYRALSQDEAAREFNERPSPQDLQDGFQQLQQRRREALALLQESSQAAAAPDQHPGATP